MNITCESIWLVIKTKFNTTFSLEYPLELTKYHPLLERDELYCRLRREPQELVERGENGDSRSWKTIGAWPVRGRIILKFRSFLGNIARRCLVMP